MVFNQKSIFKAVIGLCVSASVLLTSGSVQALNVQKLRPGLGHVDGYAVRSTETLEKYFFAFGINSTFIQNPLEQTTPSGGTRIAGVVDHLMTTDLMMSLGFEDWLTVSVDLPVTTFYNIAPTFIPARDKGSMKLGDLYFEAKFRLVKNDSNKAGFGLAVIPFVTAPTGDSSRFMGDSSATGGGLLATDWKFYDNRIYLNVGARFKSDETVATSTLTVGNEFLYGLGYQRPLVKSWDLDVIAEVYGATSLKNFAKQTVTSPLEADVTLQKKWLKNKNLITHLGGGSSITNAYSSPVYRVSAGVSYGFSLKKQKQQVLDLKGQIHFDTDKATIKSESFYVLDDVAEQMRKRHDIKLLLIEGHTDSDGGDDYNMRLSDMRAEALKTYLVDKGISADRMQTRGFGETQPIATNSTAQGKAMNRRSVFRILKGRD